MTAGILARTTRRAKLLILGNILPIQDNPVQMAEQIAMADLISGGRVLSGFVRGVGVETLVGEHQPGPQPRALRGVPRPDHQVLDRARARSAGRAGTTTSATSTRGACRCRSRIRRSGCRAPRARRPRCGPGAWATPTCRSWCSFEVARELFDFYRQGAAEAGRTVTPDKLGFLHLRGHRGHQGQGARGRAALRVAHGADPARARSSTSRRSGMRSRAGEPVRAAGAAGLAVQDELRGAGRERLHRGRHARRGRRSASRACSGSSGSATCCSRPRSRAWTTRRPCARSS